jgi:glucarate dehydratase
MKYVDGAIALPKGPGLGVTLDRDKLRQYAELFRELGPYPYDQDPGRAGWTPLVPNDRWADPDDGRRPDLRTVSSPS